MKYDIKKRNTPVATLIKNYINKKSGKVCDSRREIKRRFDYLDWKHQKKILMAFLDSNITDREWAYAKLLNFWDKSFKSKVQEMWEKFHDPKCSWVITHHFPIEYLKENIDSFTDKKDYFFICLRLAKDANFVIDKTRLSKTDYLAVLYRTGRELTTEEAIDILFGIVHDYCVGNTTDNVGNDYYRIESRTLGPEDFLDVAYALHFLNKMELWEATRLFGTWNRSVLHEITTGPEYKTIVEDEMPYVNYVQMFNIVRKYAYLALDEKYKQPTDNMEEFLKSDDWKKTKSSVNPMILEETSHEAEAVPFPPPDMKFLDDLKHNNPSIREFISRLDLHVRGEEDFPI